MSEPRDIVVKPWGPEGLRAAIGGTCVAGIDAMLANLDDVLMGGDARSLELVFRLPNGIIVEFDARLRLRP